MNEFNDLNAENLRIWEEYIADFSEITSEEEDFFTLLEAYESEENQNSAEQIEIDVEVPQVVQSISSKPIKNQPLQLDRRTQEKLRKGKMQIEARIDLHGMSREVAYEALGSFILSCAQRNLRHVLVITGKGKSKSTSEEWLLQGNGVLKTNVPYWLEGDILRPKILKYMTAQPKDGGSGALYVYLKRQR